MERDGMPDPLGYLAKVVDSVAMVGMVVRDDNPGEFGDVGVEQLLPHVGSAIDQQMLTRALDQN